MYQPPGAAPHILAVIVIFKLHPRESPTLKSLLDARRSISSSLLDLEILVWDNTPGGQDPGELPERVRYEAAPGNPGLAAAYNQALALATAEGYEWLLTLDQDSILPTSFLARIAELARSFQTTPTIAAIVPQVRGDGRNLSPFYFAFGAVPRWFRHGYSGLSKKPVYALNSAATLRVAALVQIGGYDPMYPLDVSDINLFHRPKEAGKEVFVAGGIQVSHDFSLLKKHRRMTLDRYHDLLVDECGFWDMHMGRVARIERMMRLFLRALRDMFSPQERDFLCLTLSELRRRLTTRRASRIASWKAWATARCASTWHGNARWSAGGREKPGGDRDVDGAFESPVTRTGRLG